MFHFCNLAKALGDENRVRILMILRDEPLCVCQLTALLDLAPSTTSKHLSILRQAQLIECIKSGRWVYYKLPVKPANKSIAKALQWVVESLADDSRIEEDANRLIEILKEEKLGLESSVCHSAYMHTLAEKMSDDTKEDL